MFFLSSLSPLSFIRLSSFLSFFLPLFSSFILFSFEGMEDEDSRQM